MKEIKKIVKVQKNRDQLYVNISKEVSEMLKLEKGDNMELVTENGKIVLEKY